MPRKSTRSEHKNRKSPRRRSKRLSAGRRLVLKNSSKRKRVRYGSANDDSMNNEIKEFFNTSMEVNGHSTTGLYLATQLHNGQNTVRVGKQTIRLELPDLSEFSDEKMMAYIGDKREEIHRKVNSIMSTAPTAPEFSNQETMAYIGGEKKHGEVAPIASTNGEPVFGSQVQVFTREDHRRHMKASKQKAKEARQRVEQIAWRVLWRIPQRTVLSIVAWPICIVVWIVKNISVFSWRTKWDYSYPDGTPKKLPEYPMAKYFAHPGMYFRWIAGGEECTLTKIQTKYLTK